jgi:DNA polymerase phi
LPGLPASDVLVLLLQHSPLDSTRMSGREERANLFARLFGIEALVRSGALFRASSDVESFVRTAEILLDLSAHKAWLKEGAGWCLCELLARLGESTESWKDEAQAWFLRRIGSVEMGPEKLAMLLQMRASFPVSSLPMWRRRRPDACCRTPTSRLFWRRSRAQRSLHTPTCRHWHASSK